MSEQNTAVETTAVQPENTPVVAVNAQPTVDYNAIAQKAAEKALEVSERKKESVFKSVAQQEGVEDTEALNKMLAEWKSKQKTPEQEAEEARLELERVQNEKSTLETKIAVMSKGIPAEDVDDYLAMAKVRMDKGEADSLEKALDIVIQKKPLQQQNGGAGFSDKQPPGKSTFESAWGD